MKSYHFPSTLDPALEASRETILEGSEYAVDTESDVGPLIEPPIKKFMQDSCPSPNKTAMISCLRWWLPEIFASLLSVTSLASLAILVRQYHGRSLQELKVDLPSWLTLNTLIATLSTLARVALMVPIEFAMS